MALKAFVESLDNDQLGNIMGSLTPSQQATLISVIEKLRDDDEEDKSKRPNGSN